MSIFYYVDGPVGSFKTTSLLEDLRSNPRPITIGTQTNDLSDQYETAEGLSIQMICRKVQKNGDYVAASKTYREQLKSNNSGIFAVNQKVAIACQDAHPDREHFFDEIPAVLETFKFNALPLSQEFVSGWLASACSDEPSYYEMIQTTHIRDIAANGWKDDILKGSEDIITVAQRIVSPHYRVFVHAKSYNAFKNRIPKQLQFFVVARPSLFPKNTTIVGANFENSFLYRIWSVSENVEFATHPKIKAKHTDLKHKAHQTSIYYLSERNFSKALLEDKKSPTSFAKIAKATGSVLAEKFPNEKFLYCTNTKYENFKWAGPNGTLISSNSKGWNGGRHFDMAVFLAAINYDPATFTFLLKMFGMDRASVKLALGIESAYQFVGRTSLRMKDSQAPITLILADRETANAIRDYIPGCPCPELLDLGIPELLYPEDDLPDEAITPKVVKTDEEISSDAKDRSKLRRSRQRILANQADTQQYDDFLMRFWGHRTATTTLEATPSTWSDIVQYFDGASHQTVVETKDANKMYREGFFFDHENHLLKNNIQSTKLAILDVDDVSGDILDLSKYLKARKFSHLIVNTFSCLNVESYVERDIRVRVIIPLSAAVDAENYRRIMRLLNRDIQAKFDDQFKIDPACMSINNRFYAPCRPSKGSPLFIDGSYRDFDSTFFTMKEATFLDVKSFIVRNLPEDYETPDVKRHMGGSVRKAARDIVLECAAFAGKGNGDKTFYNAAVELIKAGYRPDEAVAALQPVEGLFGSGDGRNASRAVAHAYERRLAA